MTLFRPGLRGHVWRRLLPALLLLAGSACANPVDPAERPFNEAAMDVFGKGYEYVFDRYIHDVKARDFVFTGLSGLTTLDPSLSIESTGSKVRLSRNHKLVAAFPVPKGEDPGDWAVLTTAVVAAGRAASPQIRNASAERLYEVVFDKALTKLDRYSRYATAEEARENRAQRMGFGGIGVRIRSEKGVTRVVSVIPDTPASRAGLKPKDAIVKVDGEPITGMKLRQVIKRLRGPRGASVTLTVVRQHRLDPLDLTITRAHIVLKTVTYRREHDIAYIRLARFNQRTAAALAEALNRAKREIGPAMKGVILDLRDNPGGLLDQAVAVTDIFVADGRIVTTSGRHQGSFQRYDAAGGDLIGGLPLVVLLNGRSASSSEIVAAALQDLGRAVLVGTNSFGKGSVQSVFRLPNGGEMAITWSRFHAPSGYALADLGVMPTLCIAGPKGRVEKLLSSLRDGWIETAATLHAWRSNVKPNAKQRTALRAVCPSEFEPENAKNGLEIALRLLANDGMLYARALKLSYPELAKR